MVVLALKCLIKLLYQRLKDKFIKGQNKLLQLDGSIRLGPQLVVFAFQELVEQFNNCDNKESLLVEATVEHNLIHLFICNVTKFITWLNVEVASLFGVVISQGLE